MIQRLIDPQLLAKIADLDLLARTVVDGFTPGIHHSPNTGVSIEFAQYRAYAPGDDPRFLDWKLYGRTDRLHLKQFREETNMRCTLLLDCSASMDYGSREPTKFHYARMLCACLTMLLRRQGDAAGLVAYHRDLVSQLPPSRDPRRHRQLLRALAALQPEKTTDTAGALKFLGDVLPPRGMLVVISDLLHPLDDMLNHLKSLRARRHDVLVLQISDPAEREFPFQKSATFIDAEDGRDQFVVPSSVRDEYLANRDHHFSQIREACLAAEIDIAEFTTDEPLDRALRHFTHRRRGALVTSQAAQQPRRGRIR